ncbi:MAG: NPCBM/NEW2 domain-containing protein [bacterium]
MKKFGIILSTLFLSAFLISAAARAAKPPADLLKYNAPANTVWVDTLGISASGKPRVSVTGLPMYMKGRMFRRGFSAQAESMFGINLRGDAVKFSAMVGLNDTAQKGSVKFEIWLDGKIAAGTGVIKSGDEPQLLTADLTGAKSMILITGDAGDGSNNDDADWGGALIYMKPGVKEFPIAFAIGDDTPPQIAHTNPDEYGIHGARVVGSTPGKPFLFLIPATGKKPLTYSAKNLPDGLSLDAKTGIISGALKSDGETVVELSVAGPAGSAKRKLTIVGGKDKLALTPPMGWNSWNVWGLSVTDKKVRDAADVMVNSGLAAHGFTFVNIDDGWEKNRAADGKIIVNEKFPDMKATADYVHSKGLKFGIYSSPGPLTCGRYEGSYQHEYQDADSYASWGVDYLKYDWCSYGQIAKDGSLEELKKPYLLMRDALEKSGRDVVYSLCQYGMGMVWMWGDTVGGNLWRTTGDINDSWGSMAGIGFPQGNISKYAKPGHWNDPDMLVVGKVGWGPSLRESRLTKNEQVTHITLWSMLPSPLLIGADMASFDEFTLDLLTNDDVLAVNQDPLGKGARVVARDKYNEVWARPLFDGTVAVALFNRFFEKQTVTAKWSDIKVKGTQPVRDLWVKKDLGKFDGEFSAIVPAHGAVMLKIGTPKNAD